MPFGLINAPATFCNIMNDIFYKYVDNCIMVYLDEIILYSESLDDYVSHLRLVLSKLMEHQLYTET